MTSAKTTSTGRIAGNTFALFVRQIVILGINLYMIRVLLQTLGVEDYATYAVVYSLIMMTSFLWGSIQTITQRFFAFSIGAGNLEEARACYDTNILICIAAAIFTWIALETAGFWFVTEKMNVAPDRLDAAILMFRAYFVFALLKMFSTFFAAVIMAHEEMRIFAVISVLEAVLRLGAALALTMTPYDKLVTFGALFSAIEVLICLIFAITVMRRYKECSFRVPRLNKAMLLAMLRFSGWTIFGQVTTISRNQAITILINQAFNPATVAARALAVSVGAQVLMFSNNFSLALNAPITKAWAAEKYDEMYGLIYFGSKIAFYLVWALTLPIIATLPGILTLWLGEYPAETVIFTRLALLENAIVALAFPLMVAVRAAGDMRSYELLLGSMQIMVLAISWILILLGYPAVSVYIVAIVINILMFGARLVIASQKTGLPIRRFSKEVLIPVGKVVVFSSLLAISILWYVPMAESFSLSPMSIAAVLTLYLAPSFIAFRFGLNSDQRVAFFGLLSRRFGKPEQVT